MISRLLALPPLYKGSVKDVFGPLPMSEGRTGLDAKSSAMQAAIFEYTDSYSVFDWGRMPDALDRKGQALAVLAAHWFEKLGDPETWAAFSRTAEARALRKGSRFGAIFNEIGEQLQERGLKTHYIGVLPPAVSSQAGGGVFEAGAADRALHPVFLSQAEQAIRHLVVRNVSVVRPQQAHVLGRVLCDYHPTRTAPAPRLIPLEVVFRFGCPEGSSLVERVQRDPGYMASIGYADTPVGPGQTWEFPVMELFTKLESTDRLVSLSEALAISGISAAQLQDVLLRTAWVGGLLKWLCAGAGLELADGKLEWALTEDGECMLVDAIGPDELRLLRPASQPGLWPGMSSGVQLSKEFLRTYYRGTPWYQDIEKAKTRGRSQGTSDWKKLVSEKPPTLPPLYLEIATQLYLSLANALTGRTWFADAWSLAQLAESIQKFGRVGTGANPEEGA